MAARILVTGAGGFVGRHLLTELARAFPDASVIATGLGTGIPLDITDRLAVDALVAHERPDACVHLAAVAAIPAARADPDRAWAVNLHGTLNVAASLRAHAPDATLLFVSSSDIYGASFRDGPVAEWTAPQPLNTYGATKAAADLALGAFSLDQGLRVIRARPFNHTGPGQAPDFVVAAFARQIARIEAGLQPPRLATGNLDTWRDFLDVRDVCRAYTMILASTAALSPGAIVNVASGTSRRVGDVLRALLDLAGIRPEIASAPTLMRPTDIPRAEAHPGAAERLIGWRPEITWQATLADVLADWRARAQSDAASP